MILQLMVETHFLLQYSLPHPVSDDPNSPCMEVTVGPYIYCRSLHVLKVNYVNTLKVYTLQNYFY